MVRSPRMILAATLAAAIGLGSVPGRAGPHPPPALVAVAGGGAAARVAPAPDPFPILRLRVSEEQLPDAIKQYLSGPLTRLPREEFETRVQRAGRSVMQGRTAPHVVEARYSASWNGGDLSGDLKWTILNPRPGGTVLSLDPLRVAVRSLKWSGAGEAVTGHFGTGFPTGPGVWLPGPGRHVLNAEWSAAGTGTDAERQFDLRFPASRAAFLELNLPADRVPVLASPDLLLTGPFPVKGDAGRRSWRVRFGDRTRLEFAVRGPGDTAGTGAVLASTIARYDLAPGQMSCTFEYDLRPTRGSVGEWTFAVPPGVQVTNTVVNNRAGWQIDAGTRILRVQMRQPSTGGKVLVTAVAPLPAPGRSATLPFIRPAGAIIGEERIELRIHPELELGIIDEADFRVTDSLLNTEQTRIVYLTGTLLAPKSRDPYRHPPVIRQTHGEVEFTTAEALEWRVRGMQVVLSVRLGVQVRRGDLFRLELRRPESFSLDQSSATPADLIEHITASSGKDSAIILDLASPLKAGQSAEFRLDFRGPRLSLAKNSRFEFPRVEPVGAAERDGWISLVPGPNWAVTARPFLAADVEPRPAVQLPLPPSGAAATFFYRGKAPEGQLTLAPVRPAFDSDAEVRICSSPDGLSATYRYRFRVRSGVLSCVTVFEPHGVGTEAAWRVDGTTNAVAQVEAPVDAGPFATASVVGSAASNWPAALVSIAGVSSRTGTVRKIHFVRPVTNEVVLETARAVGPDLRAGDVLLDQSSFTVPPIDVAGVHPRDTRVMVDGVLADRLTARLDGSRIRVEPREPTGPARQWNFDGLHLVTVCTGPRPEAVFSGSVKTRGALDLAVGLPPSAEVTAAALDGFWLSPAQIRPVFAAGHPELRLPLPRGTGPVRFEIRYRLSEASSTLFQRIISPAPTLAGETIPVQRSWVIPEGVAAAWPPPLRDVAAAEGQPAAEVSSFAGDAVVVSPASLAEATGWGLAAMIAALAWIGATRARRLVGSLLTILLLAGGTALILGPEAWQRVAMPVILVSAITLAGVALSHGWRRARPGDVPRPAIPGRSSIARARVSTATAAVILAALPLVASHAQPPREEVVLLLPGNGENGETILAPRALLDRLQSLTRTAEPTTVITAAEYQGRAEGELARFDATFQVYSFREGESDVVLPLADIRLEKMTVNGKPANPIATDPDLYTIRVPGPGRHEVKAALTVPISTTGPERDVRFGLPEVPVSRMVFTAPDGARQLEVVGGLGEVRAATGKGPLRIEAEIGGIKTAQLRWREGSGGTATVTVREGCVWEVADSGAVLTACYQVRVESGGATGFRFALPEGLEPVRVAARSLDGGTGPSQVRDWVVDADRKGARTLRIELAGSVEGRLLLTIECRPTGVITRQPVLRFPRPLGMERRGGVYGLRATGVDIQGVVRRGVIDFAADALLREFGTIPDLRLSPTVPVLAFSPRLDQAAELRPTLAPSDEPATVSQEVLWHVGATRANGSGVLRWTGAEPLPFLEFSLASKIAEIRGADVDQWSQSGSRVQVWFRKPVAEGQIDWFASHDPTARGKPSVPLVFEPPVPVPRKLKPGERTLRVRPADGWAVKVERENGWTSAVESGNRLWRFEGTGSPTPVRLQLYPPANDPARGFGLVERNRELIAYRVVVESEIPRGRPLHLLLRAAPLPPGATVSLEVPPGTRAADRVQTARERTWDLDVAASPGSLFRAAVVVQLPAGEPVALPSIWCGPANAIVHPAGIVNWIGLPGRTGLRLDGVAATSPADLLESRKTWPGEMERLRRTGGSLWRTTQSPATIRLPEPGPAPAPGGEAAPPALPPDAMPGSGSVAPWGPRELTAMAWWFTVLIVAVLFAIVPRVSWPEQVGLLAGLAGFALASEAAAGVGLAVWVVARAVWLIARLKRH